MDETEKVPDAPRPERILPKEPNVWWWHEAPWWGSARPVRVDFGEGELFTEDCGDPVTREEITWLAPIPTAEQLAAQAAQVAAGQALADHLRAEHLPMIDQEITYLLAALTECSQDLRERMAAFLAAFPPGGAR